MIQHEFAFGHELIVDLFAGGGGASEGIKQAFGRDPDIAVNHDADAVGMHAANHPGCQHLISDVFEVDPVAATGGRQVGLLWASPDCKHFSKAKGGKPRSKKIRGLAWVVVRWAKAVRPRVIALENVEEFLTWGPLVNGQPCPERKGQTFARWVGQLRGLGYQVEWRELRACDYGAPTIRKRFFLIARCDGQPIVWPKPTHGKPESDLVRKGKLQPWPTAAECIDWGLPVHSIFLTPEEARKVGVKRPLAPATLRRIAKGIDRFVVKTARPFIVPTYTQEGANRGVNAGSKSCPTGVAASNQSPFKGESQQIALHPETARPSRSVLEEGIGPAVSAHGAAGVVAPFLTEHANASNARVFAADEPLRTQCAEVKGGHFALVAAHMEQANAGNGCLPRSMVDPVSTVTGKGCQQQVVATYLSKLRGDNIGAGAGEPLHTISAQGFHHAEVRAFLVAYYGNEKDGIDPREPMRTVVSRERFGLVTIEGTEYAIADIGLRMLTPRELFRAQGFPENYVIDRGHNGRKLPKDAQVRMCGNSVCPQLSRAIVLANCARLIQFEQRVAA